MSSSSYQQSHYYHNDGMELSPIQQQSQQQHTYYTPYEHQQQQNKSFPNAIRKVGENIQQGANKGIKSITTGAVKGVQVANNVWTDFREFLNRGNVVDLAVGIVMGNAFTAIVTSFVKDIITPIPLMWSYVSLAELHLILKCPAEDTECKKHRYGMYWPTVDAATKAGAVTWNWGIFAQTCINFLVISSVVFLLVKIYAATFRKPAPKKTKSCDFCTEDIPIKATRCPKCTSHLETEIPTPDSRESEDLNLVQRLNRGVKKVLTPGASGGSQ